MDENASAAARIPDGMYRLPYCKVISVSLRTARLFRIEDLLRTSLYFAGSSLLIVGFFFVISGGASESERLWFQIPGGLTVFAYTYVGSYVLRKWVSADSKLAET